MIVPFRLHLNYCVWSWSLIKMGTEGLETVWRRRTKMLRRLYALFYKEQLRELGIFSLKKGRLGGDNSLSIYEGMS